MKKIVWFLRKILLIDFIQGILKSKEAPHLRFAKFLSVFSYMWAALLLGITYNLFSSVVGKTEVQWGLSFSIMVVCLCFFLVYSKTAKILKGFNEEEIGQSGYIRFITPIAPVVYLTTVVLIVLAVLNFIMFLFLALGTLFFLFLILVTFGLILFDKQFKLDNFISIPKSFFSVEKYFFHDIINPQIFILFILLIYFLIPFCTSLLILIQHYRKNTIIS